MTDRSPINCAQRRLIERANKEYRLQVLRKKRYTGKSCDSSCLLQVFSRERRLHGRSYSWQFDLVINKTFSFILAMDWRGLALAFLLVSKRSCLRPFALTTTDPQFFYFLARNSTRFLPSDFTRINTPLSERISRDIPPMDRNESNATV